MLERCEITTGQNHVQASYARTSQIFLSLRQNISFGPVPLHKAAAAFHRFLYKPYLAFHFWSNLINTHCEKGLAQRFIIIATSDSFFKVFKLNCGCLSIPQSSIL